MKKSFIYGMITILVWATMPALVKSLLGDLPDLEVLFISSLIAFLFLFAMNCRNRTLGKLRTYGSKEIGTIIGLGFIGMFLYSALYYYGLTQISSQEACILNYLWPVMVVLFSAWILKEKMTARKIISMLCSFAGIVILVYRGGAAAGGNQFLGAGCCIIAAACYGFFSVLNKKKDFAQNLAMMLIWLTTAVCAGIVGILTETWVPVHGLQWAGILWLGVMIDAVAYLLWALALRETADTAGIVNMAYLTPFLSLLFSAFFLKEKIQIRAVAALVFIVGGILFQNITWSARKQQVSQFQFNEVKNK